MTTEGTEDHREITNLVNRGETPRKNSSGICRPFAFDMATSRSLDFEGIVR